MGMGLQETAGSRSWLDVAAIGMSVICGVHCLVTPLLLVALPILGKSFWVDESFHFWMLALVIPTTTLAILSGCRRHKDRWVASSAILGVSLLAAALWMDASRLGASEAPADPLASEMADCADSSCCSVPANLAEATEATKTITTNQLVNVMGGLFLVFGHFRNFRLCRKDGCSHCGD